MLSNQYPMLDLGLGETAEQIRDTVRSFTAAEIAPIAPSGLQNAPDTRSDASGRRRETGKCVRKFLYGPRAVSSTCRPSPSMPRHDQQARHRR